MKRALSANTLSITAEEPDPQQDNNSAAELTTVVDPNLEFESKITAMDAESNDLFGSASAISGDNIVVGAYEKQR